MKYINYIINGDFDIDGIVSDRFGFKQASVLVALPVAVAGMVILSGILPLAIMADGERYARLRYYSYLKFKKKEKNIERLLKPFCLDKKQENNIKSILISI